MITATDIIKPGAKWHPLNSHLSVSGQWHQIMAQDPATGRAIIAICVGIVLVAFFFTVVRRSGSRD